MTEIDNIPDVSQYQGAINWGQVPAPIALMKVSDGSTLFDKQANTNYYGAKAAGKAVGMYHFAEWGDVNAEAQNFLKAVSPLSEGDVLILDAEAFKGDPVSWTEQFMNIVHGATGVWPLLYMNLSALQTYNWNSVLNNCGLWLADWAVSPENNIPTNHVYVMQQYTDAGSVPGIQGRVDEDAFFGTVEEFKAYGYHAPTPAPAPVQLPVPTPPQTEPSPTPNVAPTPPAEVAPAPVVSVPEAPSTGTVNPTPTTVTAQAPSPKPVVVATKKKSLLERLIALLKLIFIGKESA